MKSKAAQNRLFVGLTLILLTALCLRVWGIWFGLPFSFRADEYHEVFRALQLGTGEFNFERTGKGGYFYILFVEYGMLFVTLKLAGIVDSAQDFARYFVQDQSLFYLTGRATTALIGTINVFLAFRIGARAYGIGAGVLAAAFLTVDFLNVEHSHFVTVDVPMTCLATAALLFAVRMVDEQRSVDYRWAAFFAALATTTKMPGVLLLVPLLIGHYYVVKRRGGGGREFFAARDLWWAAAIFAVTLAVTNPGLVVNPPLGMVISDQTGAELGEEDVEDLATVTPNLYVYYVDVMADSMGWPLLVLSIGGLIYALVKRTPADVMLISFAAVFYVVFASTDSHLYYPRYILPIIVVLTLLAGRALQAVWPREAGVRQGIAVVLVIVLISLPAYRTVANNYLLTQTDTRKLAKVWFEENVPEGATVMIEGLKIEPSRLTVPLQDTAENMRANIEYYSAREPGKSKYLGYVLQVESGRTYDLELVKRAELESLDYYKSKGVQYLVIRPEAFAYNRRMGAAGKDFLDELQEDPDVQLLKSFRADPKSRPGPDIDIYEVRSNAKTDG